MFPNLSSLSTDVGIPKEVAEYIKDLYLVRRLCINVTIRPLAVKTHYFNPAMHAGFNVVRLNVSSNLEELLKSIADWSHAEDRNRVLSEWIVAVLRVTAKEDIAPVVKIEVGANTYVANQRAPTGANMYMITQHEQSRLPVGYVNVGVPPDAAKGEFGFDFVIGAARQGQPERIVQKAEIDPVCYKLLKIDWSNQVQARLDVVWSRSTQLTHPKHQDNWPNENQLAAPEFEDLEVLDDDPDAMQLYTTRITYRLMLQPNMDWLVRRLEEEDFAKPNEDDEDDTAPPPPQKR